MWGRHGVGVGEGLGVGGGLDVEGVVLGLGLGLGWWWRCEFGRGEFWRGVGFGVGHGEVGVRDLVVVGAEAMGRVSWGVSVEVLVVVNMGWVCGGGWEWGLGLVVGWW